MRRQRRIGMLAAGASAVFWIAAIVVAVMMINHRDEGGALGVIDELLRAAAVTVTVGGVILYRAAATSRSRFEHGYLAGQRDARPIRTISIASHPLAEKVPNQDRIGSNQL